MLPDDVLLGIFDFYMEMNLSDQGKGAIEVWQVLIHVCRRWRNLVFGSPGRLNLRLLCTPQTRVKDTLGVWPAFPILVEGNVALSSGTNDVIAALGQRNRVCQIILSDHAGRQLEKILVAMKAPFPELTDLRLASYGIKPPVIPDSFLGGSAPRLQYFSLSGIPFPGLPNLLLSTTHLVSLWLIKIPDSWYIPPEAIAPLISELSSLESLFLKFQSPSYRSRPDRPDRQARSLRPPERTILPALNKFHFRGVTEYLEELVARIDTPQLHEMHISFFNQINDCPRLTQFINCTQSLMVLDKVRVQFDNTSASVRLFRFGTSRSGSDDLLIHISCREPDRQLSSVKRVCNSALHPLSTVEDLYIERRYWDLVWKGDGIENTLWLQLLLPFTAVKNLYLSKEFALVISAALESRAAEVPGPEEHVGERITEVLPRLQEIFVEGLEALGSVPENIGRFVAMRRLSSHPIAISDWDNDLDTEWM